MSIILDILIGFLTGIISGFGVGGGSLLVLYLTAFRGFEQYAAGSVNLLYFTGCAPTALITHIREKRVVWKAVWPCLLAGIPLSILSAIFGGMISTNVLRRIFGFLLIYIGIKELFTRNNNNIH